MFVKSVAWYSIETKRHRLCLVYYTNTKFSHVRSSPNICRELKKVEDVAGTSLLGNVMLGLAGAVHILYCVTLTYSIIWYIIQ